ncbi:hypothetical protein GCM10022214_39470 [Actinomadura miaoliensis]|uniref:Molecular chaperone DnaJ n=1 Tax=Actinomadura miaoliensis TaxID=430685 RepID=A0ABP7W1W4_9ACTN
MDCDSVRTECWARQCRGRSGAGSVENKDDLPKCGHCAGSGEVTYERPQKENDGSITWRTSVENCHVCRGTGRCR